jgi:hypothetical protein
MRGLLSDFSAKVCRTETDSFLVGKTDDLMTHYVEHRLRYVAPFASSLSALISEGFGRISAL